MVIRVLVADDEPMIRHGVRAVLSTDPGLEVVAEAADGDEAVELVLRHRPEVAVLDIRMPGTGGIEAGAPGPPAPARRGGVVVEAGGGAAGGRGGGARPRRPGSPPA
ncbi:response regulator transcription factor, partial [Streptomyces sp. AV19]|uniref:response regulator transcription factor n=1 Tax=Streptomyces sp. AV19 TaxID=2793068 RepID=UPI001F201851